MQNITTVWGFVEQYYPNYSSSDEILRNNVLTEAKANGSEYLETDLNDSNAYVFEEAIKEFIKSQKEPEKTFYLLGYDVVNALNEEGIKAVIELIEANESYATFIFIEGVTKSGEFADALNGWEKYAILTEEEFNKL